MQWWHQHESSSRSVQDCTRRQQHTHMSSLHPRARQAPRQFSHTLLLKMYSAKAHACACCDQCWMLFFHSAPYDERAAASLMTCTRAVNANRSVNAYCWRSSKTTHRHLGHDKRSMVGCRHPSKQQSACLDKYFTSMCNGDTDYAIGVPLMIK